MCQRCVDSVKRYLPKVRAKERNELLLAATCFPFGGPEDVKKQVKELAKKTRGTLAACCAYADEQLTQAMREYNETQGAKHADKDRCRSVDSAYL